MYSKFQTLEIKMDEQDRYRNNVRDHFNGNTPQQNSHQQYGNQCQQPLNSLFHSQNQQQNWQVQQQHQQQQQQQQYQQQQQQHLQQQQYHPIPQHQHEGQHWQQCNSYPIPLPPTGFYMNREQQPIGTGQNQNRQDVDLCPQKSIYSINFQNMPMPSTTNYISQSSVGSRTHVPLPRNPQLHLPPKPCKSEVDSEEAGGDRILYRNKAYKSESSGTVGVPESCDTECLREYSKEAMPYLESARAQCAAADAALNAKFDLMDAFRSDDESTTGDSKRSRPSMRTVISAKSGDDLRSMVRSQIALQQALDQSICNLTDINEKIIYKARDFQMECNATASPEEVSPSIQLDDKERLSSRSRTITPVRPFARGSPESHLSPRASRLSNNKPRANSSDESETINALDEVVATKIISPIMRKVQRMYINNLREEMSLMEELERLPLLITEVYKSATQQELKRNS
ncbi:uncharacterized protein [Drosophila tropicalis]|uniref:uncharacterized protein isoform X2 n=1 Tax=Drosophila tropicalis TaxID=46794 RepID=UPI0035AB9F36